MYFSLYLKIAKYIIKRNKNKRKGVLKMQKELVKNKGITLVALVITIIILLILARNSNKFIN